MIFIVLLYFGVLVVTANENGHRVFRQQGTLTTTPIWYCNFIPELLNTAPDFTAGPDTFMNCTEYECWQSQLSDLNRQSLIQTFNDYKSDVATGKCPQCKRNNEVIEHMFVFKMMYHWYMELIAIYLTRKKRCVLFDQETIGPVKELEGFLTNSSYHNGNFKVGDYEHGTYIFGTTSYIIAMNEGRNEAIKMFKTLLNTKGLSDNIFNSWPNMGDRYYLGSADVFGCSILIRDGVSGITGIGEKANFDRVAFLSCVFASRYPTTFSEPGSNSAFQCFGFSGNRASYDAQTKLCYYPATSKMLDIPCQIYYDYVTQWHNFVKPCPGPVPYEWTGVDAPVPNVDSIYITVKDLLFKIPVRSREPTTSSPLTTATVIVSNSTVTEEASSGNYIITSERNILLFYTALPPLGIFLQKCIGNFID